MEEREWEQEAAAMAMNNMAWAAGAVTQISVQGHVIKLFSLGDKDIAQYTD